MSAKVLATVGAKIAGEGIEASGRVLAGMAIGTGKAVSGAAQGLGTAIAGTAKGIGTALGGALQGAMTPPDVVVNNVGIVGDQGKSKTKSKGANLPNPKTPANPIVDSKLPIDKLLGLAVNHLSSIEETLKNQLAFEVSSARRKQLEDKENQIESVSKPFVSGGGTLSKVKNAARERGKSLLKSLATGALVLSPFYLAGLDGDDISDIKKTAEDFVLRIQTVWDRIANVVNKITNLYDEIFGEKATTVGKMGSDMWMTPLGLNLAVGAWAVNKAMTGLGYGSNSETSAASPVTPSTKSDSPKAVQSFQGNSKMDVIYGAYRSYGLTHEGAKTMVAQIGRENSFQEKYLFGGHSDPHKGSNIGMMSWQGSRKTEFVDWMRSRGFIDGKGNIVKSNDSLKAQVGFSVHEMQSKKEYSKSWGAVTSPGLSYNQIEPIVGTNYVRWRRNDARYSSNGLKNQNHFYNKVSSSVDSIKNGFASGGLPGAAGAALSVGAEATKAVGSSIMGITGDTLTTVAEGFSKIATFDTEYKPWVANPSGKSDQLNQKSAKASADEMLGVAKSNMQSAVVPSSFEKALRSASSGSLEVLDPNYNLAGDAIVIHYLQSFGLDR